MMKLIVVVMLVLLCGQKTTASEEKDSIGNPRPLIGILSQYGSPAPEGYSYIAASYVKFAEASGSRVVPLLVDDDVETLRAKFDAINGVIIPGGGADLAKSEFRDQAALLLKWAIESNDKGDEFFVHGTCLGFQALCVLLSDADADILSHFDSENLPSKLIFTPPPEAGSRYNHDKSPSSSGIMQSFSAEFIKTLANNEISFENHSQGVLTGDFYNDAKLSSFFKVYATSNDRKGQNYVAMMQAYEYPITGTQFHPEKNTYEWSTSEDINHSAQGVELTQSIGNFLASEARKSKHKPLSLKQEQEFLIYNYAPTFTGKTFEDGVESNFDESYFFKKKDNFVAAS